MNMKYQVIDSQTKQVIATYINRGKASQRADRLDWEYGAYRYYVRKVEESI